MASLAALFARAEATRREAKLARDDTARLSHESAQVSREIADRCRFARETLDRAEMLRRDLPRWPAWGPPDVAELRLTLVPLE